MVLVRGGGAAVGALAAGSVRIRANVAAEDALAAIFFQQALLAGFSFRTGEHKAFAVRKIAATPEKVTILHKDMFGNMCGNVLGNMKSMKNPGK